MSRVTIICDEDAVKFLDRNDHPYKIVSRLPSSSGTIAADLARYEHVGVSRSVTIAGTRKRAVGFHQIASRSSVLSLGKLKGGSQLEGLEAVVRAACLNIFTAENAKQISRVRLNALLRSDKTVIASGFKADSLSSTITSLIRKGFLRVATAADVVNAAVAKP